MKRLIAFSLALLATSLLFAEDKDPVSPFHDYGAAMGSSKEHPLTVDWQGSRAKELAAAVSDDAIRAFVADEAAAGALLARITAAYSVDPIAAHQIGAVSQWVMVDDGVAWYDFWSDTPRADGRKVWVKALVARAETATDAYVQLFCLDQLRWCGCACPCLRGRIAAIGEKSADKHVKEMVDIVLRTLK